jgi:hypothetical protein
MAKSLLCCNQIEGVADWTDAQAGHLALIRLPELRGRSSDEVGLTDIANPYNKKASVRFLGINL